MKSLVERGLAASSARGYHWRNISEARPQAKGIERAVCIMKEGIYANWLALERHCNARIALESPLLGYLVGHVYRTYNAYCEGKAGSTPLERLREKRGGQAPRSYPFGAVPPAPTGGATGSNQQPPQPLILMVADESGQPRRAAVSPTRHLPGSKLSGNYLNEFGLGCIHHAGGFHRRLPDGFLPK